MSGARLSVVRAVAAVIGKGRSLDAALAADVDARSRALAYETLRHGPRLDWMLKRLLHKGLKPADADLRAVLLVGLCEISVFSTPDYATVDGAVRTARALNKEWAAKLVNGVLRNFLRRRRELQAAAARDPVASSEHPAWMLDAFRADWPDDVQRIVAAGNAKGPMWIRVNTTRMTVVEYAGLLSGAGITAREDSPAPEGLKLERPVEVAELPGFEKGLVSVQDAAAQLAAHLLAPQPGERLLDAASAPGGKAAHLLERCGGEAKLTALEVDAERLEKVRGNLERLGLGATLRQGDATRPDDWWDGAPFDRILLDAPCSGTGVIRRHPDIKWLRRPDDIAEQARLQAAMLEALWPTLRPNGRLLYCTCSVLKRENAGVVAAFLDAHGDARAAMPRVDWGRESGPGRQILPGERDMDGFYYAVLEKG